VRPDPTQSVTEPALLQLTSTRTANSLFWNILAITHCESIFCEEGDRCPLPNSIRIKILKQSNEKNRGRLPHLSRAFCARRRDFMSTSQEFAGLAKGQLATHPQVCLSGADFIRTPNSLFWNILAITHCESRFCGEGRQHPLPNSKRIKILQNSSEKNLSRVPHFSCALRPRSGHSKRSPCPNALFIISVPLNEQKDSLGTR
jgi:hypothetical protein